MTGNPNLQSLLEAHFLTRPSWPRRLMTISISSRFAFLATILLITSTAWAGDTIPKAAWRRPLGLPLSNPGVTRVKGDIDDGYWQGAPVGGFGPGAFRGHIGGTLPRWHIKAAFTNMRLIYANQFAMFQQVAGESREQLVY